MSPEDFIKESNKIEGIHRDPTDAELTEYHRFMDREEIHIEDLLKFVHVYQPNAVLRDKFGLNVIVGKYTPPAGGKLVSVALQGILENASLDLQDTPRKAFMIHHKYEQLHPFTDGNGHSGRMLWLWVMRQAPLGFLHTWYYQSLQFEKKYVF